MRHAKGAVFEERPLARSLRPHVPSVLLPIAHGRCNEPTAISGGRETACRRALLFVVASVGFTFATGAASAEDDWYVEAGSHCSGNVSVSAGVTALLPSPLRLQAMLPAGNFAVSLNPSEIAALSSAKSIKLRTLQLSATQAADLRNALESSSDSKVPMFFKVGVALISGVALQGPLKGAAAGWLFDEAYTKLDAPSLSLAQVTSFVAEGGELSFQASLAQRGVERILVSSQTYEVAVGKEFRSFALYSCVFPIKVEVTQFITAGGLNDKIIKKRTLSEWGQWDITDNKWDNVEPLTYLYQTPDQYYYQRPEIENGQVVGQAIHRVSTAGGPWQRKRYESTTFATLYAKVNAE